MNSAKDKLISKVKWYEFWRYKNSVILEDDDCKYKRYNVTVYAEDKQGMSMMNEKVRR